MSDIGGESRSAVSSAASGESGLGPQLDTFREVRRNLEASILPLATSVDGRRFSFQASLYGLELQVGSYVVLEGGGVRCLGQVLTRGLDRQLVTELTLPAQAAGTPEARTEVQIQYASGEGAVLEGDGALFHNVLVRVASRAEVRAWLQLSERRYAKLQLGELALVAGAPCTSVEEPARPLPAGGVDGRT